MNFFSKDKKSAFDSISYAQIIAFAPILFQASKALRDLGILEVVNQAEKGGISLQDIYPKVGLTEYGTRVLLEAGLGIGLLIRNDHKYELTKTGQFILNDDMTRGNMDFTNDVCYEGMFSLQESIKESKPTGLKAFGEWDTIYEGLSVLPKKVKDSWFYFDHYHSDGSFDVAMEYVFKDQPKHILDIGANTGKFTLKAMVKDPNVKVTMLDLPQQLGLAKVNIEESGHADRVYFHPINMLDENNKFPKGADAIWMSQFLDCFSESEIVSILERCVEAIDEDGSIYIMETFWDRQEFKVSAFSLQMTSLYFTNIANGNSQMYDSEVFVKLIDQAGLKIVEHIDHIGISHSVLVCKKK